MVRSTGSQPRIRVKVRGSKWHAADAEDCANLEAFRRDREAEEDRAGGGEQWRGTGSGDHSSRDPLTAIKG